jgi:ketosteroid isomerase-like protein
MRGSASFVSISVIAACVAVAACTIERADVRTTSGDAPEADSARVRQTIEAIATALERADLTSLDTILDDSILVIVGEENRGTTRRRGWQAYRGHLSDRLRRLDSYRIELHDLTVRLAGRSTALATCRFAIFQGGESSSHGFATGIFRRAGDNWRLEHVHVSSAKVVLLVGQRAS